MPIRLRIELDDVTPAIWRQVLVPSQVTLDHLHVIILGAMGWHDSHLHEFQIGRRRFQPEPDDYPSDMKIEDETGVAFKPLVKKNTKFGYLYDFGDGWQHTVTVEAIANDEDFWPVCLAGEYACPPEDCGGPFAYPDFLEAFSDKRHSDHRNLATWAPVGFNPGVFSVTQANALISALLVLHATRTGGSPD